MPSTVAEYEQRIKDLLECNNRYLFENRELKKQLLKATGRTCVMCGRLFPANFDKTKDKSDCMVPELCMIDMTLQEAYDHWRAKAHEIDTKLHKCRKALRPFAVKAKNPDNYLEAEHFTEAEAAFNEAAVKGGFRV